jgi:aquaporin Z
LGSILAVEQARNEPSELQKIGSEVIGTFFVTLVPTTIDVLYFTGGQVDFVSRWLARGFLTTALIYAFSEISGAHINPAVSLGFAIRGVLGIRRLGAYWLAQFAGAFVAAGCAYMLWGSQIRLGATHPGPAYSFATALVVEIIATFLLMTVILLTAEQEATVGKQVAIAVGMTVAACGFVAGPISGASMNPARSIPPEILSGGWDLTWIYALGPCLGAVGAALMVYAIAGPPSKGEREAAQGQ